MHQYERFSCIAQERQSVKQYTQNLRGSADAPRYKLIDGPQINEKHVETTNQVRIEKETSTLKSESETQTGKVVGDRLGQSLKDSKS